MLILTCLVFSFAKNNGPICQQIEDVLHNGKKYMQFVFSDSQGNYTAGYLESYDDPSKGSLFCCVDQVPVTNQTIVQMQQLQKFHTASIVSMKHHAISRSAVTQRQEIDRLVFQGTITAEQARAYYQQIEYAQLVAQAQKKAKEVRKKYKFQQKAFQQLAKKSHISLQDIQKEIAKQYQKLQEHNNQVARISCNQDSSYQQVMNQRSQAFTSSTNNATPTIKHIKINSQTAAFLQAQGIDTTQFQEIEGLPIQHQLTHELVDVLDAVADYAQQHQYQIYQTHLTQYCAHLALLSQQSNIEGALEQAIDGTNCCHSIEHYLKGMISRAAQAYQHFQTALHYLQPTLEEYALLIEQHALQGIAAVSVFEAMATAGMIVAPTATAAAMGMMIGATATIMAPLCIQAIIDAVDFGGACITGNWDKVTSDLDNLGKFISSQETVARMAELAGGVAVPTPNLSSVIDQVLSLRPVITSVQNASGEMVQSLYLMTKNQLQKVYRQGLELLQLPEFINFNMSYKKIWGFNFFDVLPKNHPALAGAFLGLESGVMSSGEQAALTQLFTQAEGSLARDIVKNGLKQAILSQYPEQTHSFLLTDVGTKIAQSIKNIDYEKKRLIDVAKQYNKLLVNQAPQEIIDIFCKCHEISIVPDSMCNRIEQASVNFYNNNNQHQNIKIQTKHIFYPRIKPDFDETYTNIIQFNLNGFHHDEFRSLEESGLFTFVNKVYGTTASGAEECFKAGLDFGSGIIVDKIKTFFSSNWSKEKVFEVIYQSLNNIIDDITEVGNPNKKYLCQNKNGLFIEIVIDKKNTIISAYPSMKNFKELQ